MSDEPTARDLCLDAHGHGCFALTTAGTVEAFHASIRDQLIAAGQLYKDADGVWHLRRAALDLAGQHREDLACCDFCQRRPVTWRIPCPSFELPAVSWQGLVAPPAWSEADWAACEPCGQLIADRNHHALLTRARKAEPAALAEGPPALRKARRDMLLQLHDAFWRHYVGGAIRLPARPFGH
jgi:hypothetical protein